MWIDADAPLPDEIRTGRSLYGNDLAGADLKRWYDAESKGYYGLYAGDVDDSPVVGNAAINYLDAEPFRGSKYEVALTLGCADGKDILSTGLEIDRIVAIEPASEWWSNKIGEISAEYRLPLMSGDIDLPDESIDIGILFGVLHHVATVEKVVGEIGRVLKAGAPIIIREPIGSMGDFRKDRPGLTRCERGIPPRLMVKFLERAGFDGIKVDYSDTPGLISLTRQIGLFNRLDQPILKLDRFMSNAMRWNNRYWRTSVLDKVAPRTATYRARRKVGKG